MNYLPVYQGLIDIIKDFESEIFYASFVGSNYKISATKANPDSDLDVLIILHRMTHYNKLVKNIKDKLQPKGLEIIDVWGIVSQRYLKKEVVHLLIDPIWNFKNRSSLFIKSLQAYPIIQGESLQKFFPNKMTNEEFVFFGPSSKLETLKNDNWGGETWRTNKNIWYLKKIKNTYADQNHFIYYCCIQSVIESLIYVGTYTGLEDFADIPEQWDKIGGPNSSFVNRLISVKRFHTGYHPISKKEACSFLTELCEWIWT